MIWLFVVTRPARINLEPKCWSVKITPYVVIISILTEQSKDSEAEGFFFFFFNFSFVFPKPTSLVKQLLHVTVYFTFLISLWFVLSPFKFSVWWQFWVIQDTAGYSFSSPFLPSCCLILTLASRQAGLNTAPPAQPSGKVREWLWWQQKSRWGKVHERAAQTATLAVDQLVCASHVSKTYHFIERSLYSQSTDILSGINFPANPLQKSQKTLNIQKHQKDMKTTSEDKTKKTPKGAF